MTYQEKSDYLDANASPLDLEQIRLLQSGDRLIVESQLSDSSKEYIRGMLRGEFADSSLFIRNEYEQPPEGEEQSGHSYLRLGIAYMDFSGRYENDGDEKLIYLDPDLETDREYSYPIHLSPQRGVSITEILDVIEYRSSQQSIDLDSLISELSQTLIDEPPSLLKLPECDGAWMAESRSTGPMLRMDDFFTSMLRRNWQSGEIINDNCTYYAHSVHLKCTVKPTGSCEGCKDFFPDPNANLQNNRKADIRRIPFEHNRISLFGDFPPTEEPAAGRSKMFDLITQRLDEPIINLAESRAQGLEVIDPNDLQ